MNHEAGIAVLIPLASLLSFVVQLVPVSRSVERLDQDHVIVL